MKKRTTRTARWLLAGALVAVAAGCGSDAKKGASPATDSGAAGAPITLALRAATPRIRKEVILPILHSRAVKAISFPAFTWFLLAGVLWLTHFSSAFDFALENIWAHRAEHTVYIVAALLFWWPAINADPSPWRLGHPVRLLYVFLQMPQNSFLGVSIYGTAT